MSAHVTYRLSIRVPSHHRRWQPCPFRQIVNPGTISIYTSDTVFMSAHVTYRLSIRVPSHHRRWQPCLFRQIVNPGTISIYTSDTLFMSAHVTYRLSIRVPSHHRRWQPCLFRQIVNPGTISIYTSDNGGYVCSSNVYTVNLGTISTQRMAAMSAHVMYILSDPGTIST